VIGDAFTDRYHIGESTRLSAEAPIPVVKITKTFDLPGGAGNVARNLDALGARVLQGYIGPFPIKNRLMIDDHQIARWDENDTCQSNRLIVPILRTADAIVIADYAKGSVTPEIIQTIGNWMFDTGKPVFVDTKRAPGYFYGLDKWYTIFFPNQKEHDEFNYDISGVRYILKRGRDGIQYDDRTLPSTARFVRSVNGAGDSVIASFAFATVTGYSDPLAFANTAAGLVVEKPYTAVVTKEEIESALQIKL
jgi:D-beta-D-heptose 7-phosphate kinase/D-beta-D-heptose 1-phosphate adenosyltransferase